MYKAISVVGNVIVAAPPKLSDRGVYPIVKTVQSRVNNFFPVVPHLPSLTIDGDVRWARVRIGLGMEKKMAAI